MFVVRTRRYPAVWQPVGGGLDPGETPRQAAVREVFEETGWVVAPDALEEVVALPMDAHAGTLLFFTVAAPPGDPIVDFGELVEVRWAGGEELLQLAAFDAARRFYQVWTRR
jgi:8-oxo-dGTP pyrophosphatase MutT (NUDIX family)